MEKFLSDMAKEKPLRFSSEQLKHFTNNFSTQLGSGGFGVVYKGAFPNGVHIAVKVLKNNLGKRVEEQFMAEVATMGRTYHINLVRLYGFCFDSTLQALVYEFMENGSLDGLLFQQNPKNIDWGIALGTAKGIAYLHEECQQRIIHYDIKPGNVLLDSNFNPKVADFGLARLCSRDDTHVELSGIKGTPGYAAPEVWMPYPVTHKCDVYSFGMLLLEMVGRRRNRVGGDLSGTSKEWLPRWVYEKVEGKAVVEMMEELGVEEASRDNAERAALVALWCVQYLPTARPNMSDVVRMLEGSVQIPTPPNPFAHLVEDGGGIDGTSSSTWGWGGTTSTSASNRTYPFSLERRIDIVDNATF
ncbi:uncharacterized protein [Phyllobates terribilis]|uniref:uncharacterized protein n=1 Tax=Phyllobates terribilis TaxID=111132 RepID=UPI003CCB05EE